MCLPRHSALSLIVNFVSVFTGFASLRLSCFQAEERPRVPLLLASGPCWSGSEDSWFSSGLPTFSSGRLTAACETTWCWNQKSRSSRFALKQYWDGHDRTEYQWTWVWVNSGSWWWTGKPGVLQSMGSQSRTWLSDWTELNIGKIMLYVARTL